jgi:hypothetical protein
MSKRAQLQAAGVQIAAPTTSDRTAKKFRARQLRALDAPDELRKVAGCPKCPAWFGSVEDRNAHKAQEHRSTP